MAIETLGLPDPVSANVNDGSQVYDLAVGFATLAVGNGLGVEWFVPTTPGATAVAKWWRVSDGALLDSKTFTPVAGTRQQILFDDPVADLPVGDYRVSVETIFFTLTSGWGGWPASSDNMVTDNPDGWLSVGPGFPNDGPRTALYHVSPIFEVTTVEPAEGTAAVGVNLAVAAAGARDSDGAAALGINFAVAATGQAPAIAPAEGTAAVTINLGVAAAGERDSSGAAAPGLNLAPAAAGARPSAGSAALGIDLAVAASGSDGSAARPRGPWAVSRPRPGRTVTRVRTVE